MRRASAWSGPLSRLAEPAILPPSALAEDARFLRGTSTHALLEHLPALPRERWAAAANAFIAGRAAQLPAAVRKSIVAETLAVLREPAFTALFGPEARAEVAIVAEIPHPQGRGPALRLAGKIDRLVRDLDSILIVDYKTNRPPPKDVGQVAEAYLLQLAAYRLAVSRIFSQQRVRAAILWTDGPRIMEIPGDYARRRRSSGSGSSTRPTLTPEGGLPTFPAAISIPPCVPPHMRPHGATQRRLVQCQVEQRRTPCRMPTSTRRC